MSSHDAQDIWFIEVSQITITNTQPKQWGGDYRIVIKHEHGTEEIISSNGSGEEVTIDCKTFVQLNVESSIEIHRAKRIKSIASGSLNITGEGKDYTVDLTQNEGMIVNLKLGETMTMSDVAAARVEDAKSVLQKETKSAEELERVTGHVKILMNVGAAAALVNKYANAAVSIAKLGFEKFEEIPAEYRALKTFSLECMKHFEFDKDAREVYTSDRVRGQLSSVMKLVIKALEFIFHYYSRSRISRFTSKLTKPPTSTINEVKDLASKLEAQQQQIVRVFAVENREILQKVMDEPLLERYLGSGTTTGVISEGKAPCFHGTRISILEKLSTWAQNNSSEASQLFWLYGIAGCGKSAVATSTSHRLDEEGLLAGSFFCRRDEVERRKPVQIFKRLAYFLTKNSPDFRAAIVESLTHYDRLDDKNDSTFVKYVLTKPLSKLHNYAPSTPFVFLVDALDECHNSGHVACVLAEIITEAPWIKLIVTSRETPEIKKAFTDSSIARVDHDLFTDDARSDIHEYLLKRLGPFPDLHRYVDELAEKSGGLFIWLHTVTEVILNAKDFLKEMEEMVRAFLLQPFFKDDDEGKMAATYSSVLEQASGSSETGRLIVHSVAGLLLATSSNTPLTISSLYAFLPPSLAKKSSLDEFAKRIMALKPVLKLTPVSEGSAKATTPLEYRLVVQTHHASFLDFCEKEKIPCKTGAGTETTRSNPFWTDPITLHRGMAMGCLEIMKNGKRLGKPNEVPLGLRFNICDLETSYKLNSEVDDLQKHISRKISPQLLYSSLYWESHVSKCSLDETVAVDKTKLEKMLEEFFKSTCSLFWLEVLSLTGNLASGVEALVDIAKHSQTEIAYEMCQFIEQCFSAISASTPHLYLSLTWLPVVSMLWAAWKSEFSGASVLKDPIRQLSPTRLLSSTPFRARVGSVSVDTFAVSVDGKYIVSGSGDGRVRLWDIRSSGIPVRHRWISRRAAIGALAYTPDGSHVLCACGSFIYELDVEALLPSAERREIPHSNVRCMAVSQVHIALGTEDGKVVILDAKTYHEVSSEQPYKQTEAVDAIAFSPDGSRLVYSSFTADVRIWEVSSGSYRDAGALGRASSVTAVAFSIDGKKIATGGWEGEIQLFDAESGEEIASFSVKYAVQFLTFSYGTRIICSLASRKIDPRFTDLMMESILGLERYRHYVMFGARYCVRETILQVWDVDFTRRHQSQSTGRIRAVRSVAFSPDGQKIVYGSRDSSVRVRDVQTGEPEELEEMKHSRRVSFVAFSPNGKFIASGGLDKVSRIWDAQTGNPVQVLEGHTSWVYCGAYSPDGMRFVSGSDDKTLRIWDLDPTNSPENHASRNPMSGHDKPVKSVAFSPDGSCIASASADSTIRLWDGKTGNPFGDPLSGHDSGMRSVAFSPDGTRLASGGDDSTVRIWDVRTRSAVGKPLEGHTNRVTSVAYSPDGAFVFSASFDGTIRCWDTVTDTPVGHPLKDVHSSSIWSLAVSPDGRRIVSGSDNGAIRIWDSQSFEWEADKPFISCGYHGPDRVPDHIPEDGWILTSEGGLLLWVPVEHRKTVCTLDLFSISTDEKRKSKRFMWDTLCHGEKWTDIRQARQ